MKKAILLLTAFASLIGVCLSAARSNASEYDTLRAESKQIETANAALDAVYQRILATLDGRIKAGENDAKNFKNALIKAECAWIKWRDAEALLRAYSGGTIGGSALMEDLHSNLIQLINQRKEFLEGLLPSTGP
jgi:uncharacterized protein YecT (DUF1311 family)